MAPQGRRQAEVSPEAWAIALLTAMKKPVTYENVKAVTGWANAEGGHWHNQNLYNPLNTSEKTARSTHGSNGISIFTSWKEGIEGTIKTLENGKYPGILSALSNGKDSAGVAGAIEQSPWAESKYGGGLRTTVANTKVSQSHKGSGGSFLPDALESALGTIPGIGPLVKALGPAAKSINPSLDIQNPLKPLEVFAKLGETVIHWTEEPLIPLKFLGGALLLYIGVREVTTQTGAGRSASAGIGRTTEHAVELASVGGVAKRGAAKLSKPKAA